ncbi:hypothetical protein Ancab_010505 [Ancistrocladus abbreviatus]
MMQGMLLWFMLLRSFSSIIVGRKLLFLSTIWQTKSWVLTNFWVIIDDISWEYSFPFVLPWKFFCLYSTLRLKTQDAKELCGESLFRSELNVSEDPDSSCPFLLSRSLLFACLSNQLIPIALCDELDKITATLSGGGPVLQQFSLCIVCL